MDRPLVPLMMGLSLVSLTMPAAAADVWVDAATGSDSNPGTEQEPFGTLARGCAEDTSDAVLVVHVRPGVYREFFETQRAGTHIVVDQADQGAVVLTGAEPSTSLTWTQGDPQSPNRLDALVWLLSDLSGKDRAREITTFKR